MILKLPWLGSPGILSTEKHDLYTVAIELLLSGMFLGFLQLTGKIIDTGGERDE
jgi:hypothetical protein